MSAPGGVEAPSDAPSPTLRAHRSEKAKRRRRCCTGDAGPACAPDQVGCTALRDHGVNGTHGEGPAATVRPASATRRATGRRHTMRGPRPQTEPIPHPGAAQRGDSCAAAPPAQQAQQAPSEHATPKRIGGHATTVRVVNADTHHANGPDAQHETSRPRATSSCGASEHHSRRPTSLRAEGDTGSIFQPPAPGGIVPLHTQRTQHTQQAGRNCQPSTCPPQRSLTG